VRLLRVAIGLFSYVAFRRPCIFRRLTHPDANGRHPARIFVSLSAPSYPPTALCLVPSPSYKQFGTTSPVPPKFQPHCRSSHGIKPRTIRSSHLLVRQVCRPKIPFRLQSVKRASDGFAPHRTSVRGPGSSNRSPELSSTRRKRQGDSLNKPACGRTTSGQRCLVNHWVEILRRAPLLHHDKPLFSRPSLVPHRL